MVMVMGWSKLVLDNTGDIWSSLRGSGDFLGFF
jgi:hypothetical protein